MAMDHPTPRYIVTQPGGPDMALVWDTWLEMQTRRFHRFHGQGAEQAKLLAETECARLNAPLMALDMLCGLALHISEARDEPTEANPGDLLEDVDKILDHFIGQLRGLVQEPVNHDGRALKYPAPRLS